LTFVRRHAHDAAVRTVRVVLVLVLVGIGLAAVRPAPVSACVGVNIEFEDALRLSHGAIYAGRITRADDAYSFWIDLSIDIDRVVRGPAAVRVPKAQAGHICDGIQVGQYGYIVRDVINPEDGPGKRDLFFRVGWYYARAALIAAGLPDTSTAPAASTRTAPEVPWSWLGFWLAATLVLAVGGLRRHRRDDAVDT
jgi:hypothetical protein